LRKTGKNQRYFLKKICPAKKWLGKEKHRAVGSLKGSLPNDLFGGLVVVAPQRVFKKNQKIDIISL